MVLPGQKPLLPRRSSLPFACRQAVDRMEMSVQRHHLASFRELGPRYGEGIHGMTFKPHAQPVPQKGSMAIRFDSSVSFLPEVDRETLEGHVLKKNVGHAWGLPIHVQRSLQSFLGEPPSAPSTTVGHLSVEIQLQEPFFLTPEVRSHLELHIQKRKLHHLWGLPGRVVESLRMLHPEFQPWKSRQMASLDQRRISQKVSSAGSVQKGEKVTLLHPTQRSPRVEAKCLERVRLHQSKKSSELRLEALPRVSRLSCQQANFSFRQPFPKLVEPGIRPLRLGTRYKEALGGMAPRAPFSPVHRAVCEYSEVSTPVLTGRTQRGLEQHLQKKKIQHLWGYPALVQRSLQGFMSESPVGSGLSKTTIEIRALPSKLCFLPRGIRDHLEVHLQKIKLQRRWGLPRRVMDSLEVFRPSHLPRRDHLPTHQEKTPELSTREAKKPYKRGAHPICTAPKKGEGLDHHLRRKSQQINLPTLPRTLALPQREVSSRKGKPLPKHLQAGQKPLSRRNVSFFLPPATRDALELNVKRKHLVFLLGEPKKHTVIDTPPPSIQTKQGKVQFQHRESPLVKVPFLTEEAWEALESHVLQKKNQHAWGLPPLVLSCLKAFAPFPPDTGKHPGERKPKDAHPWERGNMQRMAQNLPSLSPDPTDHLEVRVKHRATTRRWEIPKQAQKSLTRLRAPRELSQQGVHFQASGKERRAEKPERNFLSSGGKLLFLTEEAKGNLEVHIRERRAHHLWSLPSAVLKSLQAFAPFPLEGQKDRQSPRARKGHREGQTLVSHLDRGIPDAPLRAETTSISGPEDPQGDHPELYHDALRERETASWWLAEEPTWPATKTQHSQASDKRSWPGGRDTPPKHALYRKRGLNLHSKTLPMLKSTTPQGEALRASFRSPSSLGRRRGFHAAVPWSEDPKGSQRQRTPSTRRAQKSKGRKTQPCPSKTSLRKKKIHWQQEDSFPARSENRPTPGRRKEPHSQEDSDSSWESAGPSTGGSSSSVQSFPQEEVHTEEASTKAEEAYNSGSRQGFTSLLSGEKEVKNSGSSPALGEGSCFLPSEAHDSCSGEGMESSPSSQQEKLYSGFIESKKQEGSSSLHSKGSHHSVSFSGEEHTEEESSEGFYQPLDQKSVQLYDTLHLDLGTNFCHVPGETAMENDTRVCASSREEEVRVRSSEARAGKCYSVEPPQFPQGTETLKDHHQPQALEDAEAQERMAIIGTLLERKLHLQEGLEIWRRDGGTPKNPWNEKHGKLLRERHRSATLQKAETLVDRHEGGRTSLASFTTKPCHPSYKKEKQSIRREASEKYSKQLSSGNTPQISQACGITRRREVPRSKGEGHRPPQSIGCAEGKGRPSIFEKIFGTKLHLFDKLKKQNRGNVLCQKDNPQEITYRLFWKRMATTNSPQPKGMHGAGLKGRSPRKGGK
ncbi:hypothetical protein JRQ81_014389 [Phrynocephalus forsythii]|uniref:SPATA31 domain-containing protein n=1 Tax=Phrynocephalus forsythii TaxID=171643 RepID=A0A9Q0XWN0_9SAUR|nr:hypothetical protein JRQ81_014389 [Phrynocephalus forsythii]